MNLEQFIEETNRAVTTDQAFSLYVKAINQLGFDSAVYTFMTDHHSIGQTAGHGVRSNYPQDWMNHYFEREYHKIDPVVQKGMRTGPAFSWQSLEETTPLGKKQIRFMREAEDAGLLNGVGIPLHRGVGEVAGVGIASDCRFTLTKDMLSKLNLFTEQFHTVYCDLVQEKPYVSEPVHLTSKESEVLKWMANGKHNSEIADILHVSTATIKFHQQNIYRKLNANDRVLAVTKAIRLGLIPIDVIGVRTIFD